jgi:hypothetical protein
MYRLPSNIKKKTKTKTQKKELKVLTHGLGLFFLG